MYCQLLEEVAVEIIPPVVMETREGLEEAVLEEAPITVDLESKEQITFRELRL
jgi:hypothetical protein